MKQKREKQVAEKPVFDIKVNPDDARLAQAWFNKLEDIIDHPRMKQALINGATIMKEKSGPIFQRLVYGTKESPGYIRSRALELSTIPQGESVSITGEGTSQCKVTTSGEPKVVKEGKTLRSGLITHVKYGVHVHMGAGPNRKRGPRPYMSDTAKESEKDFVNEVKEAIEDIAKGR